jgi:hypothetical protein
MRLTGSTDPKTAYSGLTSLYADGIERLVFLRREMYEAEQGRDSKKLAKLGKRAELAVQSWSRRVQECFAIWFEGREAVLRFANVGDTGTLAVPAEQIQLVRWLRTCEILLANLTGITSDFLKAHPSANKVLKVKPEPEEYLSVPGLFDVSRTASAFRDARSNSPSHGWVTSDEKTQPYAVLLLAAEEYARQAVMQKKQIILSSKDIKTRLADQKYCSRPVRSGDARTDFQLLESFRDNIRRKLPLTEAEMFISREHPRDSLIFPIKKN